jgi:hypothetical protein
MRKINYTDLQRPSNNGIRNLSTIKPNEILVMDKDILLDYYGIDIPPHVDQHDKQQVEQAYKIQISQGERAYGHDTYKKFMSSIKKYAESIKCKLIMPTPTEFVFQQAVISIEDQIKQLDNERLEAVYDENYELAAQLRDRITELKSAV